MDRVSELGALTAQHQLTYFDCGVESLNLWLREHPLQAQAAATARTIVFAIDQEVLGYYALSTGAIESIDREARIARGTGRHPIPVVLISRFAVDLRMQGQQLGRFLLQDALLRILNASRDVGIRAVQVHPINDAAASFYRRFGFEWIDPADQALGLYLLLKDVAKAANR